MVIDISTDLRTVTQLTNSRTIATRAHRERQDTRVTTLAEINTLDADNILIPMMANQYKQPEAWSGVFRDSRVLK